MKVDIEHLKKQLSTIKLQKGKILEEFIKIHPTIIDGKAKNYAIYNGRIIFDIEMVPEKDRHLFSKGLKSGQNEKHPGALYYETDIVRKTNGDDMKRFPDFAEKLAEYNKLQEIEKDLSDLIGKAEWMKKQEKKTKQDEKMKDFSFLKQTFPGVDLNDSIYLVAENGKDVYKTKKSLEQLLQEKDALYQKAANFQGTINQRQAILQAIDKVYGQYIENVELEQEVNKPIHR